MRLFKRRKTTAAKHRENALVAQIGVISTVGKHRYQATLTVKPSIGTVPRN